MEPGEELTVEEERAGWLRVRNAAGARGWIPATHAMAAEAAGSIAPDD